MALLSEGSSSRITGIARASSALQRPSTSLLPFPPARQLFSSTSSTFNEPPPQRKQVDSLRQPKPDTATSKAERTLRRFWKKVDVAYYPNDTSPYPHLRIRLDGRSLKTPSGNLLAIPANRPLLASLIAREWAEQDKVLKMHSLPMTSLAARAIDGLNEKKVREQVCDELIKYVETETIW
jgi:ATP synthase F1 complex assembly factor 2